jgi:uncharacterized protein YecT (DUF1311 family)
MVRHVISASAIASRSSHRIVTMALAVALLSGCNRETPVRTRDEIAADSALAADLALANRDTLLIDSIGQSRPPAIVPADTELAGSLEGKAKAAPVVAAPLPAPAPAPAPVAPSPPKVSLTPRSTKPPSPRAALRRGSGDPCNSPAKAAQEACVRSGLAATDMRLNGIYRALLTEMRRQEGVRPGQKDPTSVVRLRVAQRAWLVDRDTECRRRGHGTEGALWARPRVQCLGEFASRRANELADDFSKLTAR